MTKKKRNEKIKCQRAKICCCFLAFSLQKEVEFGGEPLPDEDVVVLPYRDIAPIYDI